MAPWKVITSLITDPNLTLPLIYIIINRVVVFSLSKYAILIPFVLTIVLVLTLTNITLLQRL